jgi:hypothetical protein
MRARNVRIALKSPIFVDRGEGALKVCSALQPATQTAIFFVSSSKVQLFDPPLPVAKSISRNATSAPSARDDSVASLAESPPLGIEGIAQGNYLSVIGHCRLRFACPAASSSFGRVPGTRSLRPPEKPFELAQVL